MDSLVERPAELRETPAVRGPAVIVVGPDCIEAFIENASPAGVMIKVPASAKVPSSFTLGIGEYRQDCDLIWRNGALVGARLSA